MDKNKRNKVIEKAKKEPPKKTFSFRIEVGLMERLDEYCEKKELIIGRVIEGLIEEFLNG